MCEDAPVAQGEERTRCFLCLESFPAGTQWGSPDDCTRKTTAPRLVRPCKAESCEAAACAPCWERYLRLTMGVSSSRFACPVISCFACRTVLPTEEWGRSSEAAAQLSGEYTRRADELMKLQCARCKHTASILPQIDEDAARLGGLLQALGSACETAGVEMGELQQAEAAWLQHEAGAAAQLAAELLTLPLALASVHAALRSVRDVERRLALQLALLSVAPVVSAEMLGCSCATSTCFKCKQAARSCSCSCSTSVAPAPGEVERDEAKRPQGCPECGVRAPAHNANCASVLCVCGKYYETVQCGC